VTKGRVRLLLVLDGAAVAAIAFAVLLAGGLPFAARGALAPAQLVAIASVAAAVAFLAGTTLLVRWIARPLDRLFSAAARLEGGARDRDLPLVDPGQGGFGAAAVAFERVADALGAERARLAAKVAELSEANRSLAEARESLQRSERLATVGRLAAGVAHEVGNPLGAITAYAELARGRLHPDAVEVRDYLARIASEAARIDGIVRDLLDFARPASLRLGAVALHLAVEAALRTVRVQARFRGVEVDARVPPSLRPVHADERRVGQVLVNLFLNAADAMGGGGLLRVEARERDGRVELAVTDGGPGIPEADLPRVFDPFFTTKAPGHGTGLGLAVCHGIMESFGGAIEVASAPGRGATFTLRFRAAAPEMSGGAMVE
jgi:signal transduction histidine kinase